MNPPNAVEPLRCFRCRGSTEWPLASKPGAIDEPINRVSDAIEELVSVLLRKRAIGDSLFDIRFHLSKQEVKQLLARYPVVCGNICQRRLFVSQQLVQAIDREPEKAGESFVITPETKQASAPRTPRRALATARRPVSARPQ